MVQQPTRKPVNKKGRIIIFILRWAGLGLLVLAILATIELLQLHVYGIETMGKVVRQEIVKEKETKRINGKDTRVEFDRYDAIVAFTADKETFTIRSYDGGRDAPLYPTGAELPVVYRPKHPEKARIKHEMSRFRGAFGPLMLVVFGVALISASRLVKFIVKKL